MKNFTRFLFLLTMVFVLPSKLWSQTTVTIATGAVVAPATSFNSNPIYRSSATSGFDFSQAVYLYTATELAAAGIYPGAVISKLAWNKVTTFGTVTTGNLATWGISMKNSGTSPSATWSSTSFATQSTGATLVYNGNPQVIPAAAGWITLTLSTPFTYTGGSLEVFSNWNCSATVGNPTTGGFSWLNRAVTTSVFGTSASTSAMTMVAQANRPDIQLEYTGGVIPSCFAPSALTSAIVSATSANISWTAPTALPAEGYEYYVSTSNTPPTAGTVGTGVTAAGVTTASATGLTGNTTYFYWVRSVCTSSDKSVWVGGSSFYTGYCVPSSGSQLSWISAFSTTSGATNIAHTAAAGFAGGYQDLTATDIVSRFAGGAVDFSATAGGPTCGIGIWVDWNNNLTFETSERVFVTTGYITTITGTITVPGASALGTYRMRVVCDFNSSAPSNPCGIPTRGEIKDFTFEVVLPPAIVPSCVAYTAPTNGATGICFNQGTVLTWAADPNASSYDVYFGASLPATANINLSATTYTIPASTFAANQTISWKIVPKNATGEPTGCATNTFTTTALPCYCTPVTTSGCTDGDVIAQVVLNTLSNNSGTGCPSGLLGYSDYTSNPALTTTLQAGSTYACVVSAGQYSEGYAAWIDYNDDGTFDPATERIGFTSVAVAGSGAVGVLGSSASFPITLSCNPPLGVHRLRVRAMFSTAGSAITPCGNNTYGEVEDYLITIAAADPCPTPSAGLSSAITQTGAELTWTTGCAETSWDVHVTTAGSGAPTGAASDPGVTKPYIKTGLTAGTAYEYWVRAVCTPGSLFSSWAGPYTFTTLPLAPNCATYITPLAGANLLAPAPIDWDAPTTGGVPSGYKVYIDLTPAPTTLLTTTAAAVTAYVPTALVAGSLYYYQIVPTNSAGDATGCAIESFVYTVPPPPVNDDPTNATALVLSTQVCQNTTFATVGTEETASNLATVWAGSTLNNTVFYKFTPTVPGKYNLTLSSPAASTQVMQTWAGIYTYAAPTFTEVTAPVSNTTAAGLSSIYLTATLTAGVEYTIMVEGFSGSFGDFCIQLDPSCVGNSGIGMLAAGANPLTQMCGDALSTFTYYGITSGGANQYCLAIEWGTNTASKAYAEANNTISMFKSASVTNDVGGPGAGVSTLGQYWNVGLDAASQLTTPVRVQFYYTPADLAAVTTAAGTFGTATTPVWFKTEGVAFSLNNPALQNQTTGQYIGMTQLTAAAPVVDPNGQTYVQLSGITSFSGGSVAVAGGLATPLPLKLVSYKGAARGTVNELSWTTASEENIREFMVERSVDGKNWITVVGKTTAKGSKTTKQTYTMTDNNPVCAAYYRLTSSENDGRTEKLGTVQILRRCEKFNIASVFPNPSSDKVNVQYESTNDTDISVTVLDMTGRVVLTSSTTALIGFNTTELDLSSLTSGTYIISMNNGQNIITSRVTKN